MKPDLSLLWRGPLSSCNYDCHYCPFAKNKSSREELAADEAALDRFRQWVSGCNSHRLGILFTPWGEAVIRRWYRAAIVEFSHLEHVRRVAIQTNGAWDPSWLERANLDRVSLWITYHPGEVGFEKFLVRVRRLHEMGVKLSVGTVGLPEHRDLIERMRNALPDGVYLWINAYKSKGPDYYDQETLDHFARIDPLFPINNTYHPSAGQSCDGGESALSIDGEGNAKRCHFVDEKLGNIFEDELEQLLKPRVCPNATCGCYIGYIHLKPLGLKTIYGDGFLERIPNHVSPTTLAKV
ncbi:MAG: STM4011 family radical SAM protein [Myxococcota bacterium]